MTIGFLAALLFLPAGSLGFWQAWLLLGLMSVFWSLFLANLLQHDPEIVSRRLRRQESEIEQKVFQVFFKFVLIAALLIAGLDFRFGWSRKLVSLPFWLILLGQCVTVAGYSFVFWVMKTNSFAGSTIEVEADQHVVSTGPYATVRHPMYLGIILTALGIPISLGSFVAFPLFALFVPVLIYRLTYEERTLRRDFPGYLGYCERVRFRLLPWIY